jgi:hypothetical protein
MAPGFPRKAASLGPGAIHRAARELLSDIAPGRAAPCAALVGPPSNGVQAAGDG